MIWEYQIYETFYPHEKNTVIPLISARETGSKIPCGNQIPQVFRSLI